MLLLYLNLDLYLAGEFKLKRGTGQSVEFELASGTIAFRLHTRGGTIPVWLFVLPSRYLSPFHRGNQLPERSAA